MKFVRKITSLIGLVMLMNIPYFSLRAEIEVNETYADSLCRVLQQTKTPVDRIPLLKELSNIFWQQPAEVIYLREVVDVSLQLDSFSLACTGMSGLCRYYFNAGQSDSLIYWRDQLNEICRQQAVMPDEFYRVSNLLCRYYQESKNYELAISEALSMLNEARRQHNNSGIMRANQSLGLVYQGIGRNSDAVVAYREGWAYADSLDITQSYELQYLSEMIVSFLDENLLEESEQLLSRYDTVHQEAVDVFAQKGIDFPIVWHQWLVDSYYAGLYMKKGDLAKAGTYVEKAGRSVDASDEYEDMKYEYYRIKAIYNYKVKKYAVALEALEKALKVETRPDLLKLTIDVLRADGRKAEAMARYDELFSLNAQINNEAFDRQIHQLRILNDLNDQETQTFELRRQNEQLAMRQQLLIIAMIITLLLLVLSYLLYRNYRSARKLKDALLGEKQLLLKSEKCLRIAKEKAENANQAKTEFISNISHEVRTPLNAIVGFSRLIAEDNTYPDKEKKEFTRIIRKNSELLLHLVNNVLDLSRLESDKIKLSVKPCDLVVCCEEVVGQMIHTLAPEVKLRFAPSVNSYMLDTDAYRLKQLLDNLLRNAAKFTCEGEINLSFEIDEANRQVSLMVTDTGCGIPAEKQMNIFDYFVKLDEFAQGTGLGLSICQRIACLLKGRIYLDTDYTAGTRFVFIPAIRIFICCNIKWIKRKRR